MDLPAGLGRPLPLRCRGAIHLYSAHDEALGRTVTVALPAPRADTRSATGRIDAARAALNLLSVPLLPRVVPDRGPALVLDHATVALGDAIVDRLADGGRRLAYPHAAGFVEALLETLVAVGAGPTPHTFLGFGWPSFLCDAHGRLAVLGPGDPLVLDGGPAPPGVFFAPEVAAGGVATPSSDLLAAAMLVRSMVGAVELPAPVQRVLRGAPEPGDAGILAMLVFANTHLYGGLAFGRPSAEDILQRFRQVWRLLRVVPDFAGLQDAFRHLVAEEQGPEEGDARDLTVDPEGAWLEPKGLPRVTLGGRGPLRRVLVALVRARLRQPGAALHVQDLLAVGWPGENPIPEAGANRVYQSIAVLRRLGLREAVQRWDGGYRVDPRVRVSLAS